MCGDIILEGTLWLKSAIKINHFSTFALRVMVFLFRFNSVEQTRGDSKLCK